MAEQKIYFQWQNDVLCRTIYPLRTMNLRNTLEYLYEIDLWKQYKGRSVKDMPEKVAKYHEKMAAAIKRARHDYQTHRDYFVNTPFDFPEETFDKVMAGRIRTLHDSFIKYYDKSDSFTDTVSGVRRLYFLTQRLDALDRERKELDKKIAAQERYKNLVLAASKDQAKLDATDQLIQRLKAVQPLFDERREHLTTLFAAFGRLETYRKNNEKQRKSAEKKSADIERRLVPVLSQLAKLKKRMEMLVEEIGGLVKSLLPPSALDENYFATPDLVTTMGNRFPKADPVFCAQVDDIREGVASLTDPAKLTDQLRRHIATLQRSRAGYQKQSDAALRESTLQAFDEVLAQLQEYLTSLDNQGSKRAGLESQLERKRQEDATLKKQQADLEGSRITIEAEKQDVEPFLIEAHEELYIPVPPKLGDLIRLELDEYVDANLKVKVTDEHGETRLVDKDQYQLLAMLIERFKKEPERFPRWLQYMIVHFSGMRYASAHGSWGDPKDLYLNLRMQRISEDLEKIKRDDMAVEGWCKTKSDEYAEALAEAEPDEDLPKYARSKDAADIKEIKEQLALMQREDTYSRWVGLNQLLMAEEEYEIRFMTQEQALEGLESLRAGGYIPAWMWKEISAMTGLRLTEAQDPNWEKLTPAEQAEKSKASGKFREIINTWKTNSLTGWRAEHDRTNELIVSRAVCNEVAEHIVHLRGHKSPAGLSGAADWYHEAAKKSDTQKNVDPLHAAYFVRPKDANDYRPGAGILWLKYRRDNPPPWNIVKPFTPTLGRNGAKTEFFPSAYTDGGRWHYTGREGMHRTKRVTNEKGRPETIEQYLYWVHIATVAEVMDIGNNDAIVLTYETNLPGEDRRLSCVGVFRRYLHNLTFDGGEDTYNGSLVGYVPDNLPGIPEKDLDEMLDWDKVLLRS